MYLVFEENAAFRLGLILSEEVSAYMIELKNSRRLKLKKNQVLTIFHASLPADFLSQAEALSREVDVDVLWECLEPGDHPLMAIAQTYFGDHPSPVQVMAVLYVLHTNPFYFYKRGKGQYRLATAENLRAAQAGAERKERERLTLEHEVAQLCSGIWPYSQESVDVALFSTSTQHRLMDKALVLAAEQKRISLPMLLASCGCISGPYEYWYRKFTNEYGELFQKTIDWEFSDDLDHLQKAGVRAFSIDDSTTTEIDDAFSVTWSEDGLVEVGIHIASPTLGCRKQSDLFALVRERMSTVYLPGDKFTMFPPDYVEQFTLKAGRECFSLSLYCLVDPTNYTIVKTRTRLEKVWVADNLRLPDMLIGFAEEDFDNDTVLSHPWGKELQFLYRSACVFLSKRQELCAHSLSGKSRLDYHFYIDHQTEEPEVSISVRPRGQPVDLLVAEWMVMANWHWATFMKEAGMPMIYRGIDANKVRLSSTPLAHKSMGLDLYAWFTSPLRRYIDLQNQYQLVSCLALPGCEDSASVEDLDGDIMRFQALYTRYDEFQRTMERYWSLVWLSKRQDQPQEALVLYDRQLALQAVPVSVRVPAQQTEALSVGQRIQLRVDSIDLWTLTMSAHIDAAANP